MSITERQPFNLQKAMEGYPIETRDGRSVTFGAYNPDYASEYKIVGWLENKSIRSWTVEGLFTGGRDDDTDIFMLPPVKPFNIKEYNKDSRIVTRAGRKVLIAGIHPNNNDVERPIIIIGWIENDDRDWRWNIHGKVFGGIDDSDDLFIIIEPKKAEEKPEKVRKFKHLGG